MYISDADENKQNKKKNSINMSEIESETISKLEGLTLQEDEISVKVKRPKRTLHFSDGIIEEFSSDEDEVDKDDEANKVAEIDESKLTWGPWLSLKAWKTGNSVLAGCDYVGESLASLLGITSHKYSYEIEQFKKMQEQAAKEEQEDKEAGSFIKENNSKDGACITEQDQLKKY